MGNIAKHAAEADHDVEQAREDVVKLRKNIGKTFTKADELEKKRARVKEIEAELAALSKQEEGEGGQPGEAPAAPVGKAAAKPAPAQGWTAGDAGHKVQPMKIESLWKDYKGGQLERMKNAAQQGYLTDGRVAIAIGDKEKKSLPPGDPAGPSFKAQIEQMMG